MRLLALAAALILTAATAEAGIIVTTGVNNAGTDNVISNACTVQIDGPALTIQGCLNTDHNQGVVFVSDENIVYAGGGQAQIVSQDANGFSTLTISLDNNKSYSKLLLN